MTEPDEHDLVERARAGDESAFAALCEAEGARLRAQIGRRIAGPLRRKVSVLDVLQETYLAAYGRIEDFEDRGDGAFGAWIARIAELKTREVVRRYLATDKRNVGQEVTRGHRPDTAAAVGREPSPSEMAVASERRDAIAKAMDDLPEAYRRVLQLVQVERVPLEVAASLMGRSREAVRKLYGRALANLADRLDLDGERER